MENIKKLLSQKENIPQTNGGVKQLFEFIKNNPNLRLPQIAKKLNISSKTLEEQIKKFKDEEKIEFIDRPKIGGYFIKEGNNNE